MAMIGGYGIVFALWYVFDFSYTIEQGDVESLAGIATGAGSIALAIPLFFKDLDQRALYWKQFFFIAFGFLFAALISVFCLMKLRAEQTAPVKFSLFIVMVFAITTTVQGLPAILCLSINKINRRWAAALVVNPSYTFFASLLTLGLTFFQAEGSRLIILLLLLTIYGLYLMLVLCLAFIFRITVTSTTNDEIKERMESAIEDLLESNREKAFTEGEILIHLLDSTFRQIPEVVNETILDQSLHVMQVRTGHGPKVIKFERKFIPRWRTEYERRLQQAEPRMLIFKTRERDFTREQFYRTNDPLLLENLCREFRMSEEMIKRNDVLRKKYFTLLMRMYMWQLRKMPFHCGDNG
jgi:hypothetical protein